MKTFTIFWLDGETSELQGTSISDAFNRAGYGGGSLAAVDFWREGKNDGYVYDKVNHRWTNPSLSATFQAMFDELQKQPMV